MASIKAYIITRILLAIPTVLILLTLVFILLRAIPGNPFLTELGEHYNKAVIAALNAKYGLDKPIYIQYFTYLSQILRGDFGNSLSGAQRPVLTEIFEKLPATIELTVAAMFVALLVGILGGVYAAYYRSGPVDYGVRFYGNLIYSMPIFVLGLIFQIIFASHYLHWLPAGGRISSTSVIVPIWSFQLGPWHIDTGAWYVLNSLLTANLTALQDALFHLILPALTLGLVISGVFTRITRANMLDTLKRDFITAGRARGLSERRVIYDHALRNASVPIFTLIGLQFALLLAGAIITETIFTWPGIGKYLLDRIEARDFTAVQGAIVIYAILVASISTLVDIIYAFLDPRIRL